MLLHPVAIAAFVEADDIVHELRRLALVRFVDRPAGNPHQTDRCFHVLQNEIRRLRRQGEGKAHVREFEQVGLRFDVLAQGELPDPVGIADEKRRRDGETGLGLAEAGGVEGGCPVTPKLIGELQYLGVDHVL